MKGYGKKIAFLLAIVLTMGIFLQVPSMVQAAGADCKSVCKAALDVTGGSDKLKYQSTSASEFGGFTVSEASKAVETAYLCDDKEVYSICVVKAANKSGAKALEKAMKSYKKRNSTSGYLSDYSATEQKVFKNALCGRKGKFVWYIAMSDNKSVNKKGQTALKKAL